MVDEMQEPNEFFREYFMQTRKELSAARGELNRMINFALLIIAAFSFAILQNDQALTAIQNPVSLVPLSSALVLITLLFWFRKALLQDMTNRWFVLARIAKKHFSESTTKELLESVVISSIGTRRYVKVNIMLTMAMSSPVYGLILLCASNLGLFDTLNIIVGVLIIFMHIGVPYLVLREPLISPFA